jgi:hypothetical protein
VCELAVVEECNLTSLDFQVEPNPWAERAKEDLKNPLDRPRSRMSFSIAEDHTTGFDEFLEGGSPKDERVGSARDWRPGENYDEENKLTLFQQEIGLVQPQVSGLIQPEPSEVGQLPGEASDNSLSVENSLLDDYEENDYESPLAEDYEDPEVMKERILQKRTVAGVISTYKDKNELQSALERRAALKFIQQKRADVDLRQRELKAVEERRDEIQEHLDEIDGKVHDLQSESERLFREDQFAHRDRCAPAPLSAARRRSPRNPPPHPRAGSAPSRSRSTPSPPSAPRRPRPWRR